MEDGTVKSKKQNLSLSRALTILETMVAYSKPVRLLDIAKDSGLNTSTVYRFLNSFIESGYAKRNEETQTYSLTLKLAKMGFYCMQNYQLKENLRPFLESISNKFQESAALCIENNMQIVYIHTEECKERFLSVAPEIGKIASMHSTAEGKIFLSTYSEEKLKLLEEKRGLKKYTPYTITSIDDLNEELDKVRSCGYAWCNEENELGSRTLSVPVRSFTDKIIASISMICPVQRFPDEEEAIKFMLALSKEASEALGCRG